MKKYIPFKKPGSEEIWLKEENKFGNCIPPDNWPRGDDAVWEHNAVLEAKSRRRIWQDFEDNATANAHIIINPEPGKESYTLDELELAWSDGLYTRQVWIYRPQQEEKAPSPEKGEEKQEYKAEDNLLTIAYLSGAYDAKRDERTRILSIIDGEIDRLSEYRSNSGRVAALNHIKELIK